MRNCVRFIAAWAACWPATSTTAAAPPQLTQVTPLAVAPSEITELVVHGQGLQDARRLWTSFASRVELLQLADEASQKGELLTCRVTTPREEQVGIVALRLATGEGASNPLLLMIDDLPSTAEATDNHTAGQSQTVAWPIAIDGQCDPVQEDFYRIHAEAGQTLSFEVVSQRLGFKLDSLLRVMTAEGQELVSSDDAEGAGGDSRLSCTFESSGEYVLSVRDVRHAGGGEHRYRLRIGQFPLASAVYPAGGRGGAVVSLEAAAKATDPKYMLHVALPPAADPMRHINFGVPAATGRGSGWIVAEIGSGNEAKEAEPNDEVANATPSQLPGALNGRVDGVGDRDCFRFDAVKGDRLHFVAKIRELGGDGDVHLTLSNSDGSQVAAARQERDTSLAFAVPDDGAYVLQIENLLVGESAAFAYRIDAVKEFAGFALYAELPQYTVPQGGTFVVKVMAQRHDYAGPIELRVEGLDDVRLEGQIFEGAETLLKITVPKEINVGELRQMTIIGRASIGDRSYDVRARQGQPLATVFPNTPVLPWQLRDEIAVGFGPPFPPFFDLSLPRSDVYFPQRVGVASFDVNIARTHDSFKDQVSLVIEGLPPGVIAEAAPLDDGLKTMRVTLKGPADLPEGEHPLRIIGMGKFQEQTRTVVMDQARLRVTKPLVASLRIGGPIVAGGQQQAELQIERFGDHPQSVEVRFIDGPAGLAAPIVVAIPADECTMTIQLHAASDAPAGKFDNLVLEASTTVLNQSVVVRSNASGEILAKTAE